MAKSRRRYYNEIAARSRLRLDAISDGIFGVAMTLLVLTLVAPTAIEVREASDTAAANPPPCPDRTVALRDRHRAFHLRHPNQHRCDRSNPAQLCPGPEAALPSPFVAPSSGSGSSNGSQPGHTFPETGGHGRSPEDTKAAGLSQRTVAHPGDT